MKKQYKWRNKNYKLRGNKEENWWTLSIKSISILLPSTVSCERRGTCAFRFLHLIKAGSSQTLWEWFIGASNPIGETIAM